jgi:hypothetical protein
MALRGIQNQGLDCFGKWECRPFRSGVITLGGIPNQGFDSLELQGYKPLWIVIESRRR